MLPAFALNALDSVVTPIVVINMLAMASVAALAVGARSAADTAGGGGMRRGRNTVQVVSHKIAAPSQDPLDVAAQVGARQQQHRQQAADEQARAQEKAQEAQAKQQEVIRLAEVTRAAQAAAQASGLQPAAMAGADPKPSAFKAPNAADAKLAAAMAVAEAKIWQAKAAAKAAQARAKADEAAKELVKAGKTLEEMNENAADKAEKATAADVAATSMPPTAPNKAVAVRAARTAKKVAEDAKTAVDTATKAMKTAESAKIMADLAADKAQIDAARADATLAVAEAAAADAGDATAKAAAAAAAGKRAAEDAKDAAEAAAEDATKDAEHKASVADLAAQLAQLAKDNAAAAEATKAVAEAAAATAAAAAAAAAEAAAEAATKAAAAVSDPGAAAAAAKASADAKEANDKSVATAATAATAAKAAEDATATATAKADAAKKAEADAATALATADAAKRVAKLATDPPKPKLKKVVGFVEPPKGGAAPPAGEAPPAGVDVLGLATPEWPHPGPLRQERLEALVNKLMHAVAGRGEPHDTCLLRRSQATVFGSALDVEVRVRRPDGGNASLVLVARVPAPAAGPGADMRAILAIAAARCAVDALREPRYTFEPRQRAGAGAGADAAARDRAHARDQVLAGGPLPCGSKRVTLFEYAVCDARGPLPHLTAVMAAGPGQGDGDGSNGPCSLLGQLVVAHPHPWARPSLAWRSDGLSLGGTRLLVVPDQRHATYQFACTDESAAAACADLGTQVQTWTSRMGKLVHAAATVPLPLALDLAPAQAQADTGRPKNWWYDRSQHRYVLTEELLQDAPLPQREADAQAREQRERQAQQHQQAERAVRTLVALSALDRVAVMPMDVASGRPDAESGLQQMTRVCLVATPTALDARAVADLVAAAYLQESSQPLQMFGAARVLHAAADAIVPWHADNKTDPRIVPLQLKQASALHLDADVVSSAALPDAQFGDGGPDTVLAVRASDMLPPPR